MYNPYANHYTPNKFPFPQLMAMDIIIVNRVIDISGPKKLSTGQIPLMVMNCLHRDQVRLQLDNDRSETEIRERCLLRVVGLCIEGILTLPSISPIFINHQRKVLPEKKLNVFDLE